MLVLVPGVTALQCWCHPSILMVKASGNTLCHSPSRPFTRIVLLWWTLTSNLSSVSSQQLDRFEPRFPVFTHSCSYSPKKGGWRRMLAYHSSCLLSGQKILSWPRWQPNRWVGKNLLILQLKCMFCCPGNVLPHLNIFTRPNVQKVGIGFDFLEWSDG